jgi:hypothetical protein
MTDETLRTLVHEDAFTGEPPFNLSPDDALRQGRRTVRRDRGVAGLAGLVAVAAVAAVVSGLGGGDDRSASRLDAASQSALAQYDAQLMPALIDQAVKGPVGQTAPPFVHEDVAAQDSQDQRLPAEYRKWASSWVGTYDWGADHRLRVALMHSRSEAEGDPDRFCREDLAVSCVAGRDEHGNPVISEVVAVRKDTTGPVPSDPTWMLVQHPDRADPSSLYWERNTEVRRGGEFVTSVSETVKAPTLVEARKAWYVDPATLREVADDPVLVFPAPPKDDSGCAFVLHNEDHHITCGVPAPGSDGGQ